MHRSSPRLDQPPQPPPTSTVGIDRGKTHPSPIPGRASLATPARPPYSKSSVSAVVRLQCRQKPTASEAEGEVLRAFKREVMEQRAIIIKALSEVSAFGET